MNALPFNAVTAILVVPVIGAALLALLPGYKLTSRLNVVASLITFLAALSLFVTKRPEPGDYFLVDHEFADAQKGAVVVIRAMPTSGADSYQAEPMSH